jgi:SNF2 family DNA or RNA helicase
MLSRVDGGIRVLAVQIAAGGLALTLTKAHRVIFAELDWTPANIVQCVKRCHRIGQQHSVRASFVSLAGSLDESIANIMARKTRQIAALEERIAEQGPSR